MDSVFTYLHRNIALLDLVDDAWAADCLSDDDIEVPNMGTHDENDDLNGLRALGGNQDRAGWKQLSRVLQEHSRVHFTEGMTTQQKANTMQEASGEVRAIERRRTGGSIFESNGKERIFQLLGTGQVFLRNNTLYEKPALVSKKDLQDMDMEALRTTAREFGFTPSKRGRAELMSMILGANDVSRPLEERLMVMDLKGLEKLLARLGGRRIGLNKKQIIRRLVGVDRWKWRSNADLQEALRKAFGGLEIERPRSAYIIRMLMMHDSVAAFVTHMKALVRLTLPELLSCLREKGGLSDQLQMSKHRYFTGVIPGDEESSWLRQLGYKHGRQVKKADLMYRLLMLYNPMLTACLVDDTFVKKLSPLAQDTRTTNEMTRRARQAVCFSRFGVHYRSSNSDSTWTVNAHGKRVKVGSVFGLDKRVNSFKASYPHLIARRVETLLVGGCVPHSHVSGLACLFCDRRFRHKVQNESDEKLSLRLQKSKSTKNAWRESSHKTSPGKKIQVGAVEELGVTGRFVLAFLTSTPMPEGKPAWTRKAAVKAVRAQGLPFPKYSMWPAISKLLPSPEHQKMTTHVHLRNATCWRCPTRSGKALPISAVRCGRRTRDKKGSRFTTRRPRMEKVQHFLGATAPQFTNDDNPTELDDVDGQQMEAFSSMMNGMDMQFAPPPTASVPHPNNGEDLGNDNDDPYMIGMMPAVARTQYSNSDDEGGWPNHRYEYSEE